MLGGQIGDLFELLSLERGWILRGLQLHPGVAGEIPHRVDEALSQEPLEECDGVAADLAAEAVEPLQIGGDVERGGLLLVEGALAFEAPTRLLQLHEPGDDGHDVDPFANLFDLVLGNTQSRWPNLPPLRPSLNLPAGRTRGAKTSAQLRQLGLHLVRNRFSLSLSLDFRNQDLHHRPHVLRCFRPRGDNRALHLRGELLRGKLLG